MAKKDKLAKVTSKEFISGVEAFLAEIKESGSPLAITGRSRPFAVIISAREYAEAIKKLEAYEEITSRLDNADRKRMRANAKAMAAAARRHGSGS